MHLLNKNNISARITPLIFAALLVASGLISILLVPKAGAVAFTKSYVRLDHLTGTTTTGGRVCATPSATNLASTEGKVVVTFPTTAATDFSVNGTAANWTVDTT